ncbi:MAG: hypothetical protein H7176_12420 [Bdellovibrionales bacterium]|nr:hypothetical protein [Massilia sp.]
MHQPATNVILRAALSAACLLCLPSQAQQPASSDSNVPAATARKQAAEVAAGGPARWQTEDATVQARLRSIRKEAAAGLQENLGNCRAEPAAARAACNREARTIYQQEMAGARARAAAAD